MGSKLLKHLKTSQRLYNKAINKSEGAEAGVSVLVGH